MRWNDKDFEDFEKLTCFLTMKMTFNLNKFWHEVRQYQGSLRKKFMTIQL